MAGSSVWSAKDVDADVGSAPASATTASDSAPASDGGRTGTTATVGFHATTTIYGSVTNTTNADGSSRTTTATTTTTAVAGAEV